MVVSLIPSVRKNRAWLSEKPPWLHGRAGGPGGGGLTWQNEVGVSLTFVELLEATAEVVVADHL